MSDGVFADVSICARIPDPCLMVSVALESTAPVIAARIWTMLALPLPSCAAVGALLRLVFLLMLEDLRQLAVVCPVRPPAIATGWAVELQLLSFHLHLEGPSHMDWWNIARAREDVAVVLEVRRGLVVAETHGSGVEEPCQCDLELDRLGAMPESYGLVSHRDS